MAIWSGGRSGRTIRPQAGLEGHSAGRSRGLARSRTGLCYLRQACGPAALRPLARRPDPHSAVWRSCPAGAGTTLSLGTAADWSSHPVYKHWNRHDLGADPFQLPTRSDADYASSRGCGYDAWLTMPTAAACGGRVRHHQLDSGAIWKFPRELSFRSASLSREESVTMVGVFLRKLHYRRLWRSPHSSDRHRARFSRMNLGCY